MTWLTWAALLLAGAVWLVVPPSGERRLLRVEPKRLPGWLAPVPDALDVRPRGMAAVGLGVAVVMWAAPLGWPAVLPAGLAAAASFVLLGRVTPAGRARRSAELVAALPQVCDLLAVATAAGLPLRGAVEVVAEAVGGPASEVLGGVAAQVRLGEPEAEAWAELEAEPALAAMAREISRTISSGLGLTPLLRDLATGARRTAAAAALVRARQVGVRSVMPLMCAFLPSFLLLGVVPVVGGIIAGVLP